MALIAKHAPEVLDVWEETSGPRCPGETEGGGRRGPGRGGAGSGCGRRAGRPGPTARLRLLREPRAEAAARRPGGSALGSPGQRRPVSEREGARGPGTRAPGRRLRCVSGLPLGLLGSHAFQKRIRLAPSAVSKR